MLLTLRKWRAVFGIWVQDTLAYRASAVIWILTDVVTAITMPLVFASAAGGGDIQGLRAGDFALYYLAMLMLGAFISSHIMWEVSTEIREGIFSIYLVRPMSVYQFFFLRAFPWRLIRTIMTLPFMLVLAVAFTPIIGQPRLYFGWEFWTAVLLGHLVSFTFVMAMAMIALFVQEATAVFELYYIPQIFLSGYLFPVALLPDWARALAGVFPFYYTTGATAEILIGRISGPEAHRVLLIQVGWIVASFLASKVLWRFGLRHYTGIGM